MTHWSQCCAITRSLELAQYLRRVCLLDGPFALSQLAQEIFRRPRAGAGNERAPLDHRAEVPADPAEQLATALRAASDLIHSPLTHRAFRSWSLGEAGQGRFHRLGILSGERGPSRSLLH